MANIHSGIWICFDSYGNNVSYNNAVNTGYGIMIGGSSYGNTVLGNYVTANVYAVVLEESSHDNVVLSNDVVANSDGIALDTTFCNSISNNNVTENVKSGILLYTSAYNNTISDNDIMRNGEGLRIRHSSNNAFYHNNIADNTNQVFSENSTQTWDDGYPSGGNYWSDYAGLDRFGGPLQDQAGSDGIGDAPLIIDSSNQDGYPLTKLYEWDSHDVGITSLTISGTLAMPQIYLHINITVFNYGSYSEVFNVTVYANTTAIGVFLVDGLLSRTCVFIGFTWNATGFEYGDCSIRAKADAVEDEIDTVDNSLSLEVFVGWITGDVDGNGLVNLLDLYLIALRYGTQAGEPAFSPDCDINTDGKINMLDLYLAAIHYGERSL
jgi:parallel beta-helix repeat protein